MSRARAPRLAGTGGGVGTTTLATALRGHDRGRDVAHGVDVLVCRGTGHSLQQAAATVSWLAANGRPRPLLAVTADRPGPVRGAVRARVRMIEPQVAALVVLPHMARWRELADPLAEAAELAQRPAEQQTRALRGYADALAGLAQQLVRTRLLTRPEPDLLGPTRPRPAPVRVGPSPRRAPPAPRRISTAGPVSSTVPVRAVGPPPRLHRPVTADAEHLDLPLARITALGGGTR